MAFFDKCCCYNLCNNFKKNVLVLLQNFGQVRNYNLESQFQRSPNIWFPLRLQNGSSVSFILEARSPQLLQTFCIEIVYKYIFSIILYTFRANKSAKPGLGIRNKRNSILQIPIMDVRGKYIWIFFFKSTKQFSLFIHLFFSGEYSYVQGK